MCVRLCEKVDLVSLAFYPLGLGSLRAVLALGGTESAEDALADRGPDGPTRHSCCQFKRPCCYSPNADSARGGVGSMLCRMGSSLATADDTDDGHHAT